VLALGALGFGCFYTPRTPKGKPPMQPVLFFFHPMDLGVRILGVKGREHEKQFKKTRRI
jgi:hypothetical protein